MAQPSCAYRSSIMSAVHIHLLLLRFTDGVILATSPPEDVGISGFHRVKGTVYLKAQISNPEVTESAGALICTRIPSPHLDACGTTECALDPQTKLLLFSVLKQPRPPVPSLPKKVYEIRQTTMKGLGMFALRKLDVGDLIVVERPLVVMPAVMTPEQLDAFANSLNIPKHDLPMYSMPRLQAILEVIFRRMTKENQEAFSSLENVHIEDRKLHLLGRMRTNAFGIGNLGLGGELFRYDAVGREVSRVNHSCRPNCALSFHTSSFSVELRASKTIEKDEEILLSYCSVALPSRERQIQLSYWKFICRCYACKPPGNDIIRTSITARLKYLEENIPEALRPVDPAVSMRAISANPYPSNAAVKPFRSYVQALLRDMEADGLQGSKPYLKAMEMYGLATIGHAMTAMATIPKSHNHREYAETRMHFEGQASSIALQMMNKAVLAHYGSSHNDVEAVKRIKKKFSFMAGREC